MESDIDPEKARDVIINNQYDLSVAILPSIEAIISAMPSLLRVPPLCAKINALRQHDPFNAATKLLVDHVLAQEVFSEFLNALRVADLGTIADRFFGARVGSSKVGSRGLVVTFS